MELITIFLKNEICDLAQYFIIVGIQRATGWRAQRQPKALNVLVIRSIDIIDYFFTKVSIDSIDTILISSISIYFTFKLVL